MSESYEDIYSPQTIALQAGNDALVRRQEKHQLQVQRWEEELMRKAAELKKYKIQVEEDKLASHREQADNWTEQEILNSEKADVEHQYSLVKRDQEALFKKEEAYRAREAQRKRERTLSLSFIQDSFAEQSPAEVVHYLNHSSVRIKKHAMANISFCVDGPGLVPPFFAQFQAPEIAAIILPELEKLLTSTDVSGTREPIDSVMQFSEEIVSTPAMAKALALSGQCPRLSEYLVHKNELLSRLAYCSLNQMISSESAIASNAYNALVSAINTVPIHNPQSGLVHPSITFFEEMSPKIIGHLFDRSDWSSISPLVNHPVDTIRQVVLPKIVYEARYSDRVRHGLVEAHTIGLLERHYTSLQPPSDITEFFVGLLPLLAPKMCRHLNQVRWLMDRLAAPNPTINKAVVAAFRNGSRKDDPIIHGIFLEADLLNGLNNPPTQASPDVTKLICDLLLVLAIPHARTKSCSRMIHFLDHAEESVASACLGACKKILDSSVENRIELYSTLSNRNFTKEITLKLCDYAFPILCKDWAASERFSDIARLLFHSEKRVRIAAHRVWYDLLSNTPQVRAKVGLDELFQLCRSVYEDCVNLGSQLLPSMAIEIAKAGAGATRKLLNLLTHPRLNLRQAALRSILVISESSDVNCEVLRAAEAFTALKYCLNESPLDDIDSVHRILVRLAPLLSDSRDVCCGLLQLLCSKTPQVESAIRSALASISCRNIEYRKTLRDAILDCLDVASDTQVEFSEQAIREWIGSDLAQLNDFQRLFQLSSQRDRRIQNAALFSLKQRLSNEKHHDSLEKAGIMTLIQFLSDVDSVEAVSFAAFALRSLPLILGRNGHVRDILLLLAKEAPEIRAGASTAIRSIADGFEHDKKRLIDEDIIEGLTGRDGCSNQMTLQLSVAIIPKLAADYVRSEKARVIVTLIDHKQQEICSSATKAVTDIASGTEIERKNLRVVLLSHLNDASAALRDVASTCLEKSFAHDLVCDGDYQQLFSLLENQDPCIRAAVISEFRRHIQTSSEATYRILVDAGILPVILRMCAAGRDDVISFTADCILPILGPSFTQKDGGASLIPLLRHDQTRVCSAAALAIRNGVESRYGSLQNIANSRIVCALHPMMEEIAIRDLWCFVLPHIASLLSFRDEIDILFTYLAHRYDAVRKVASEAIRIMAEASDDTRSRLFPALCTRLDGPPACSLRQIAHAVSLSGSIFVSSDKEADLLHLISHGEPPLAEAAVNAVLQVLREGHPPKLQKLADAAVFTVAVDLHESKSQRKLSLKLLDGILRYLCSTLILDEGATKKLLHLFDDPDVSLSRALYESIIRVGCDASLLETSPLPRLLPILLDIDSLNKPLISKLLTNLAQFMVPRLLMLETLEVLVRLISTDESTISAAYLRETRVNLLDATEREKDLLVNDFQFAPTLERFLKSRDAILRRTSAEIVSLVSEGSSRRASVMMDQRVHTHLVSISIHAGMDAQAGIDALWVIFSAAPHYTNQLVEDSLPTLRDILEDSGRSVDVYTSALRFLKEITQRAVNVVIFGGGITKCLVTWLSPQHNVSDIQCRHFIFDICETIAQSEQGRRALIDRRVLPVLSRLAADNIAQNVIRACRILKALAQSGTYHSALLSAGIKDDMERITSLFHKSTLKNKSDKELAQEAAKEVLFLLKPTRRVIPIGNYASLSQGPDGAQTTMHPMPSLQISA